MQCWLMAVAQCFVRRGANTAVTGSNLTVLNIKNGGQGILYIALYCTGVWSDLALFTIFLFDTLQLNVLQFNSKKTAN